MSTAREDVLKATRGFTGRTIPVHIELGSKQVILAQPEMRELLAAAEVIAVGNCACRREERRCSNPLEVCLSIGDEARTKVADHGWRKVSLDEAEAILDETSRRGLIHMAYRRVGADIGFVCSCCSCCCWPLNGLRRFDYHDAITESAFVASFDRDLCSGCGACVDRCVFGAYSLDTVASRATFDAARCFGCGLCVGSCPTGAVAFVRR